MKVFLSELTENKLLKLSDYILENWNLKARDKFIEKLTEKIKQISKQPESCPQSSEFKGLYKCVVTKQTTFYYRISTELNEIEIITIFDTRQNPNRLKKDI
ncbi:type II toxin-antitoxin system RelE/ParE family toxin [Flavivirga aquimarina]|uniref:Type II toxin-antitoxin system RelE/ParE family toxin n=2 Tax=Flavivirga TaxID=1209327 RepID=A0ABT8WYZ9_9FLAO|nr:MULTISPECIES: type II toxin-antitoxin system RelE/ParE family toxin [Flavivirga]MDO5969076.1 type II toxin-antitoxin system RelE/ParE family toxin [Flavivirga aquimarina]MDO5986693.1 type II toxin-antitoxin system RelE/ParE family toxin [Flavivirga amylovorans]